MSITNKKLSASKLASSRDYREAFVSSFLKRYIPFQIRTIRKKRGISQKQLADDAKVTQGVISRAEDPDYGNLTFNTVLRIAAGYDLAFVGKFVRFSELLKTIDDMSEDAFDLPGFVEECEQENAALPTQELEMAVAAAQVENAEQPPLLGAGAEQSAGRPNPQVLTMTNDEVERAELQARQRFYGLRPKPPQTVTGAAGAAIPA